MRTQQSNVSLTVQYNTKVRDMAFQVQFFLQMCEGNNLVRAIGFPGAETNDIAVQLWVRRNYMDYYKLESDERIRAMATDLFNQMFEYHQVKSEKGKKAHLCVKNAVNI